MSEEPEWKVLLHICRCALGGAGREHDAHRDRAEQSALSRLRRAQHAAQLGENNGSSSGRNWRGKKGKGRNSLARHQLTTCAGSRPAAGRPRHELTLQHRQHAAVGCVCFQPPSRQVSIRSGRRTYKSGAASNNGVLLGQVTTGPSSS